MPGNTSRAGLPWSREEEDLLLENFAAGSSIPDLAWIHQRTANAIEARLCGLLALPRGHWGQALDATPEEYRRQGRPIVRGGDRRTMPNTNPLRPAPGRPSLAERQTQSRIARGGANQSATTVSADELMAGGIWANPSEYYWLTAPDEIAAERMREMRDRIIADLRAGSPPPSGVDLSPRAAAPGPWADPEPWPIPSTDGVTLRASPPPRPITRASRNPDAPDPVDPPIKLEEVPVKLATVPLDPAHYDVMALHLKGLRPTQEGRAAAAVNSALNKLAYRLADVFEGQTPQGETVFNRERWLDACGVKGETR